MVAWQALHQRVPLPCLPPRSQAFVNCFRVSSVGRHGWGLTSSTDLIRPRGDDQTTRIPMTSRPITAQLVLDRVNPYVHPEQPSPTTTPTPTSPTHRRRESDPGRVGPLPSEAASPVDTEDCHDDKTRKHVCHRCGKRFNRPSSLTIHYHTHTGERREHY
jgi:hypothetical protein